MKKILETKIPIYAVIILFIIIGFLLYLLFAFLNFHKITPNYEIFLDSNFNISNKFIFGDFPKFSQPDFYLEVKQKLLNEKIKFLEADLDKMQLYLYEDGQLKINVPILAKGKEGSFWETPAGLYKINTKEKNHFSSFGRVYMPYSMQFQGNFFIHGWPYYPNGKDVESTYSGGCIRLSNADAKKIFEMTQIGMPLLVFEKSSEENDNFNYIYAGPKLSAESYLAIDLKNNFVLANKNNSEVLPIASLVKFLTAITSIDYIDIEREIYISKEMLATTSVPRLKTNQKYSLYELLFPLLLESSNEAGEAISRFLGRERFINLLNQKANSLGMTNTKITDPTGVEASNVSTPNDLFLLAKYLYFNRKFILNLSNNNLKDSPYSNFQFKDLKNFNIVFDESFIPNFIGGKIGKSTASKESYLGIFEFDFKGVKRPIAFIILGSSNINNDLNELINWVLKTYE
jgi:D-alanyl-D-alanine carboxypeptidase